MDPRRQFPGTCGYRRHCGCAPMPGKELDEYHLWREVPLPCYPRSRASRTLSGLPLYHTPSARSIRSEEHTSELQSHSDLVCRLLLEKKKTKTGEAPRVGRDVALAVKHSRARSDVASA